MQEFTAEFNRRWTLAKEEKFDLGDRGRGWWYLRQGRFSDEQRRWILGETVRNDWSKVIQIQENAIGMPDSLQGAVHYCELAHDGIFHADDSASWAGGSETASTYETGWDSSAAYWSSPTQSWEEGYWEIYAAYKDTHEKYEQLVAAVAAQ